MIRKLGFLALLALPVYFILASGQFGGIPTLIVFAYLALRAAPAVGRDVSRLWHFGRGRRKLSTVIYSRGSDM